MYPQQHVQSESDPEACGAQLKFRPCVSSQSAVCASGPAVDDGLPAQKRLWFYFVTQNPN